MMRWLRPTARASAGYDAQVATASSAATPDPGYQPFETMRYDPATRDPAAAAPGFVRFERHLARWRRSCAWLGVELDDQRFLAVLNDAVSELRSPHRVRVTLSEAGEVEVSYTPLTQERFNDTPAAAVAAATALQAAGGTLGRAALARQSVDETDPARAHKTTARELYYSGRAYAEGHGLDDVLFLDSGGSLAEGSISSVFLVRDVAAGGPEAARGAGLSVFTPPLSSGALPGVLREELVERGLVTVRDLSESDLRAARAVLLGSSVRGLRQVVLEDEPVDLAEGRLRS